MENSRADPRYPVFPYGIPFTRASASYLHIRHKLSGGDPGRGRHYTILNSCEHFLGLIFVLHAIDTHYTTTLEF